MRLMRRFSDQLRILADRAWNRGEKEVSSQLHSQARDLEMKRKQEGAWNDTRREAANDKPKES